MHKAQNHAPKLYKNRLSNALEIQIIFIRQYILPSIEYGDWRDLIVKIKGEL